MHKHRNIKTIARKVHFLHQKLFITKIADFIFIFKITPILFIKSVLITAEFERFWQINFSEKLIEKLNLIVLIIYWTSFRFDEFLKNISCDCLYLYFNMVVVQKLHPTSNQLYKQAMVLFIFIHNLVHRHFSFLGN